jgi:hypothetical protein
MTAPSDLKELLARVEKATGADRGLDVLIAERFDGVAPGGCFSGGLYYAPDGRGGTGCPRIEQYTASLDASLALVERVLPDAPVLIGMRQTPETQPWARLADWRGEDATGSTPALALLVALLKALLAKENDRG